MSEATPVTLEQKAEEALVELFKIVADGEIILEQRRAQLCGLSGFNGSSLFAALAGSTEEANRRCIRLASVRQWLVEHGSGPPADSSLLLEELSHVILRATTPPLQDSGIGYNDLLQVILPRADMHHDLRNRALTNCEKPNAYDFQKREDPVAIAFRRLVEEAVHILRKTADLKRKLKPLLKPDQIFALIRRESQNHLNAKAFKQVLYKEISAMPLEQIGWLMQHLDVKGVDKISLDDIKLLMTPTGTSETSPSGDLDWAVVELQESTAKGNLLAVTTEAACNQASYAPLQDALSLLASLGNQDLALEDAKAKLKAMAPVNVFLPQAVFRQLDRSGKGYATETDFWQMLRDAGRSALLPHVETLVRSLVNDHRETNGRFVADPVLDLPPGEEFRAHPLYITTEHARLRIRHISSLVLSRLCAEMKVVRCAGNDAQIMREVRQLAAAELQHFIRPGRPEAEAGLPSEAKNAMLDLVVLTTELAVESSRLRRELSLKPPFVYGNMYDALIAELSPLATQRGGLLSLLSSNGTVDSAADAPVNADDLRYSLHQHGLLKSEFHFDVIWDRVAIASARRETTVGAIARVLMPDDKISNKVAPEVSKTMVYRNSDDWFFSN